MRPIPRDPAPESSASLLREGYGFIRNRCQQLQAPLFQTRLLMQNTICLSGEEGARLFYDDKRFQRAGAAPRMLRKTLLGEGGVQTLDGAEHHHRKQLFMRLLDDRGVADLVAMARDEWDAAIDRWGDDERVQLHHQVQAILTRAVCAWAGVPLPEEDVETRRDQLATLIDGAGGIGARHWRARWARKAAERWGIELIEQVRERALPIAEHRALAMVARHRDLDGALLEPRIAAVELLNLLRPTVAVSRFILYAALELHAHPEWHERLREDDHALELFAQEVRRLYAFFPFMAARVREDFQWQGYHFPKGTRVLLDLFGTNREPTQWPSPDAFDPQRFDSWNGSAFNFITQGGGDAHRGHRCPGERLAIALLVDALRVLTRGIRYRVPEQDLDVDLTRMPAQPESGLVIEAVERQARVMGPRAAPLP